MKLVERMAAKLGRRPDRLPALTVKDRAALKDLHKLALGLGKLRQQEEINSGFPTGSAVPKLHASGMVRRARAGLGLVDSAKGRELYIIAAKRAARHLTGGTALGRANEAIRENPEKRGEIIMGLYKAAKTRTAAGLAIWKPLEPPEKRRND